jgi:hypothetical protein
LMSNLGGLVFDIRPPGPSLVASVPKEPG